MAERLENVIKREEKSCFNNEWTSVVVCQPLSAFPEKSYSSMMERVRDAGMSKICRLFTYTKP